MRVALIISLFSLTSCGSLLVSGNETFTGMYVKDSKGCEFKRAVASTTKLNRIGFYDLSFYLEYDGTKIQIPHMEMDLNHNHYVGEGTNGKKYIVTYDIARKATTIKVESDSVVVEVSTVDICKQTN